MAIEIKKLNTNQDIAIISKTRPKTYLQVKKNVSRTKYKMRNTWIVNSSSIKV